MTINDLTPSSVLDNLDYAYFELDLSGAVRAVNETACRSVDYTRDEIIGLRFRHFVEPSTARDLARVFDAILKTGQPQKNVEFILRKRDGTLSYAEGAAALIRDAGGEPIGFRGLMVDANDRRQAEAALQRAHDVAERDLEIGRRIQAGFLPDRLPQPDGWEIAARLEPAREVAGDFYDAFTLSSGKRIGLVVADVCDKGVGAALFMALFRSLIRAFADQHYSLGWMDVLSGDAATAARSGSVGRRRELLSTGATALKNAIDLTNKYIARNHGKTSMFATVFFGMLDPATGALMYINAGHEPPIIIGPNGIRARLKVTGPAVGLYAGLEFGIEQIELKPGDTLLAFTDGVLDARDPDNVFFGEERLSSLVQEPAASALALLDRIHTHLLEHIADANQFDDITLLALKRIPSATDG